MPPKARFCPDGACPGPTAMRAARKLLGIYLFCLTNLVPGLLEKPGAVNKVHCQRVGSFIEKSCLYVL